LGGFFGFSQSSLLDMSLLQRVPAPGTWVTRFGGGNPCNYNGCGFGGDNGPVFDARFCRPKGIAADLYGNLYIADTGNHRIRKVFRDGTVITIAGTGVQGSTGDGGRALQGQIVNPQGIVVSSLGTVFFTDGSNRIRVLTPVR
jgi:hypothetical protein